MVLRRPRAGVGELGAVVSDFGVVGGVALPVGGAGRRAVPRRFEGGFGLSRRCGVDGAERVDVGVGFFLVVGDAPRLVADEPERGGAFDFRATSRSSLVSARPGGTGLTVLDEGRGFAGSGSVGSSLRPNSRRTRSRNAITRAAFVRDAPHRRSRGPISPVRSAPREGRAARVGGNK